jgi:hypothetical protein
MNPRNSVKHPALVSSRNRALSWYLSAVLHLNSHPERSEGPAVSFDVATQTNAPSSTSDAKIGGPNISIPYFAINSFITSVDLASELFVFAPHAVSRAGARCICPAAMLAPRNQRHAVSTTFTINFAF